MNIRTVEDQFSSQKYASIATKYESRMLLAEEFLIPVSVLHVLGAADEKGSSIARIVEALATEIDPRLYRLHACFLGVPGPLVDRLQHVGVPAKSIPWDTGSRDPNGAFQFWHYLRQNSFSLVHQHFGARSIRYLVKATSKARIIVQLHAHIDGHYRAGYVPIAVRGANRIIAVSQSVAQQVRHLNPNVIYPGVTVSQEELGRAKTTLDEIVIGAAGHIIPSKGFADLVQAMALLRTDNSNIRLEIAGMGPERANLEREAARLGLSDVIAFCGWRNDLKQVMRTWDIFVSPSYEEGFGLTVLEAMAEGLPVIATSVGGLPEIVVDQLTGFLVPPRNPAAIAKQIQRLIAEPEIRSTQAVAGRQRARETFSIKKMAAEIRTIYDDLCHPIDFL